MMRTSIVMSAAMTGLLIAMIVACVLILAVILTIVILVKKVQKKVQKFSSDVFGTEDIAQGIRTTRQMVSETPRSVSSMTKVMEPLIARDFPDFSWPQFRARAENMLLSVFAAIRSENIDELVNASDEVREHVKLIIKENQDTGTKEFYNSPKIHKTEISNYQKEHGKCIIDIQSAVEYYHFKKKDGQLVSGDEEFKVQTKYKIELVYIQDETKFGVGEAIGLNCPNCGAPVVSLGKKYCEYCGTGIQEINIKVWALHKFDEVDYNH